MNGRMLSRAIHRTSPATIVAAMRTATRGESGANRRSPGPAVGSMNGGSGRPCHPSRQGGRRTVSDGRRGLVHGAADYQTWNDRPAPRPGPRTGSPPGPRSERQEEPGEAPVPLPASAGGSSSPATRPHPSSPGASWATHGTRRSPRPGCRSIGLPGATGQRSRSGRPSRADGPRGRAGRPRPHRDATHLGRPRGADRQHAARLAPHRPV